MKTTERSERFLPGGETEEEIRRFKEEVAAFKDSQMKMKARGENYDPHFEVIDPDSLTEEDMRFYNDIKNFGENRSYEELAALSKRCGKKMEEDIVRRYGGEFSDEAGFRSFLFGDPEVNFDAFLQNQTVAARYRLIKKNLGK